MGHKVNPISFRLGINRDWDSKWFADKEYGTWLLEDLSIRKLVKSRLQHSGLSRIVVERTAKRIRVIVFSARPGIAIGRKGLEVERLTADLQKLAAKEVKLDVIEEKKPDLSANLVAEMVANQLTRRISYRRAMKKAIQSVMAAGAVGVRIQVGGRLSGSEIARRDWQKAGSVPLHTIKADIDFARITAFTSHGTIGVKVWISRGFLSGIPELETVVENQSPKRPGKGPVRKDKKQSAPATETKTTETKPAEVGEATPKEKASDKGVAPKAGTPEIAAEVGEATPKEKASDKGVAAKAEAPKTTAEVGEATPKEKASDKGVAAKAEAPKTTAEVGEATPKEMASDSEPAIQKNDKET